MEERTRNRAVGAVVLLLAAVIVLPLALESAPPGQAPAPDPAPADPPEPSPDRIRITTLEGKEESPPPPPPKPARAAEAPARPAGASGGASGGGSGRAADPEPAGAAPDAGWAVQIGSFAEAANAEKLRAQVAARGYRVLTQRLTDREGRARVRVLVGPDRTRAAAAAWRSRLEREDSIPGFLVRYPG